MRIKRSLTPFLLPTLRIHGTRRQAAFLVSALGTINLGSTRFHGARFSSAPWRGNDMFLLSHTPKLSLAFPRFDKRVLQSRPFSA